MICGRCGVILHKPLMVLGASWMWKCVACSWQIIAPGQFKRGRVERGGVMVAVIEASGVIDAP